MLFFYYKSNKEVCGVR